MGNIPTLHLTMDEYKNIIRNNRMNSGGESIICYSDSPISLYKFFNYKKSMSPEIAYQNKEKKIDLLSQTPNLEYSTLPTRKIALNGKFIGYEMTTDPTDIPLSDAILTEEQVIAYLKRVRFILDYYASRKIVYGDVKSKNILINPFKNTTKFCDIDNIKIGNLPIDAMTDELMEYTTTRGKVDSTADSYMFNLLTLEQLSYQGVEHDEIASLLKNGTYPENFHPEAYKILDSMQDAKTYNGDSILRYVKKSR